MPTIGRATIDVFYDGKDMPAQAKKIGRDAGAEFGEEFSKQYPKEIDKGFRENAGQWQREGEKAGKSFEKSYSSNVTRNLDKLTDKVSKVFSDTDGLDNYRKGLFGVEHQTGNVTKSTTILRAEIDQLTKAGVLSKDKAKSLTDQLTLLGREQRKIESSKVAERTRDEAKAFDELVESTRRAVHQEELENERSARSIELRRDLKRAVQDLNADRQEENRLQRAGAAEARDLEKAMRAVDSAFLKLNPNLKEHNDAFARLKKLSANGGTANEFTELARDGEKLARMFGDLAPNIDLAGSKSGSAAPKFSKLGGILRGLSQIDPFDNVGQLFLLIVALAPQVAVLANAAGGGLLILAGAVAALGAAGVGYGFVFSNLFGDLKKVDPAIRPAAKALQDFGKTFGDLRLELQKQVLTPAVVSQFRLFSTNLAGALQSGFSLISPALQSVLLDVSRDLNSAGFKKDFDALFASFTPTIKSFGGVLRNSIGIIGQLLTQAAPYVQDFVRELEVATGKFLAFLKTPEGKRSIKDFLDNATRTLKDVGDAAVVVGKALLKLVTPENVKRTGDVLKTIGDTAPGLAAAGDALGDLIAQFGKTAKISEEAGQIGQAFEDLFTDINQIGGNLAGFFLGVQNQINTFVGGIKNAFSGVGTAFAQAAKGDFAGAAATLKTTFDKGVQYARDFKTNIAGALGDTGALFRGLDSTAQRQLTALAGRFDIPKAKSQDFGGEIARLAAAAGVDISSIAGSKSWAEIGAKLGLTGTSVKQLVDRFGEIPPVKSTKVTADGADSSAAKVKNLDQQIKGLKDKVVKAEEEGASPSSKRVVDLQNKIKALQGKKIEVKEQGAADSASRARILKEKVDALKAKTIQVNETGAAPSASRAKTLKERVDDLRNKVIQVNEQGASASSGRVSTLTAKILGLKGKSVDVSAVVAGAAAVGALAGAIAGLHDKTVSVRTIQSTRNANRFGGIMKAGQQIAGGQPIGRGVMAYAKGGILRRPTFFGNVLAGEAGPEAIVPLSGALSRVDRSVRDLSAIARGRATPVSVNTSRGGRTVTVEKGAIVVQSQVADGRQVASSVLDRLDIAVGGS